MIVSALFLAPGSAAKYLGSLGHYDYKHGMNAALDKCQFTFQIAEATSCKDFAEANAFSIGSFLAINPWIDCSQDLALLQIVCTPVDLSADPSVPDWIQSNPGTTTPSSTIPAALLEPSPNVSTTTQSSTTFQSTNPPAPLSPTNPPTKAPTTEPPPPPPPPPPETPAPTPQPTNPQSQPGTGTYHVKFTYFGSGQQTTPQTFMCGNSGYAAKYPSDPTSIIAVSQTLALQLFHEYMTSPQINAFEAIAAPMCTSQIQITNPKNGASVIKTIYDVCDDTNGCLPNDIDFWDPKGVDEVCGGVGVGSCEIDVVLVPLWRAG